MKRFTFILLLCVLLVGATGACGSETYHTAQGEVVIFAGPPLSPQARLVASSPLPAAIVCAGETCRPLIAVDVALPPGKYRERLTIADGEEEREVVAAVQVDPGDFPVEALTLPSRYVTPGRKIRARIMRENRLIRSALAGISDRPVEVSFAPPVPGDVTEEFGTRRVINRKTRGRHLGVDLRAAAGERVRAAGSGRVVLAGNFYLSGNSVFIDHGDGVYSMYFHLSRIAVRKGERVAAGAVIGRAGATGRSAGPHLHFGMRVKGAHVDPLGFIETLREERPAGREVSVPPQAAVAEEPAI